MTNQWVKVAVIIGGVILLSVAATIYFSPYLQCVRAGTVLFKNASETDETKATASLRASALCSQGARR